MTGWNPIGCLMDSSDVTILQIVFSLDGRTQIDSQFANANSDDPSASISPCTKRNSSLQRVTIILMITPHEMELIYSTCPCTEKCFKSTIISLVLSTTKWWSLC
jgi:hypothetical protein